MGAKNPAKAMYGPRDKSRLSNRVPTEDPIDEKARSPFRRDYARLLHSAAFRRLQGKTQLFPSTESDFFRNRLTHSLEVGQIACSIAHRLNATDPGFKKHAIDCDLIETAALAHDLGHPPFGHNGEEVLNEWMVDAGGFEGNAQTLRILSRIEKRMTSGGDMTLVDGSGKDLRLGLDLTARTLAAVLKYDKEIPITPNRKAPQPGEAVKKGYYATERGIVAELKLRVAGDASQAPFKTVECQIMDIADDIAYSTYDLEDAFKGGFLTPLKLLTLVRTNSGGLADKVTSEVKKSISDFTVERLIARLDLLFEPLFASAFANKGAHNHSLVDNIVQVQIASDAQAFDGYTRTRFTSDLVNQAIHGVHVKEFNTNLPALSVIEMSPSQLEQVEILKRLAFELIILSPSIAVVNRRGREIVSKIFEVLLLGNGHSLLPDDHRLMYSLIDRANCDVKEKRVRKKRLICDFVCGMTDRYAVEFYGRLVSERPATIFKPL